MLFDSNVFNMIDWFADGVEPRTGMYIRTIPIATLPSNSIQGPILNFILYFNQFNNNDYGFGVGWEMSLAHIDSNTDGTRTLVLSNGNRYKILSESGSTVTLQYKVSKDFNFVKDSTDTYRIINKDGSIETLQNGRVSKITAPNSKAILFAWNADNAFTITDSSGTTLVSSKWSSNTHIITTPQRILNLQFSDPATSPVRALLKVQEGSGKTLTLLYEMTSQLHNTSYYCLSGFTSILSYYQNETLTYTLLAGPPGIPGSIMAVSVRDTFWFNKKIKDKTNRITIKTNYAYQLANYLGYPLTEKWTTGVDNLEKNHSFEFETVASTGGMRTVNRRYNNFYLPVSLVPLEPGQTPLTPRNGKQTSFSYALNTGKDQGIDAQSPTFLLPTETHLTRLGIGDKKELVSTTSTVYHAYDSDGNLSTYTSIEGIVTRYTYYPATGQILDGTVLCPADPNGFVNYISSMTITPGKETGTVTSPVRKYEYQYKQIPTLPLVVRTQEVFYDTSSPDVSATNYLLQKKYNYEEKDPTFIGALTSMATSKPAPGKDDKGKPIVIYLTTQNTTAYSLGTNPFQQATVAISSTITGFDGSTKSTSISHLSRTGATWSSTDENNLTTTYEYDSLGRVVKRHYPWGPLGTEIATDSTNYSAASSAVTTQTTREAFKKKAIMDGFGNIVSEYYITEQEVDKKIIATFFEMKKNTYNKLMQLVESIDYDYTLEKKLISTEKTIYQWNICDDLIQKKSPDKSQLSYVYDYYNNTVSATQSAGMYRQISFFNTQNQLVTQKRISLFKNPLNTQADQTDSFTYDGYGRQKTTTSDIDEDLTYTYDAFDRVMTKKGSVSGTQQLDYAPHSTAELATRLTVDRKTMGTSGYDGIDRLTGSTVNLVQSTNDYSGSTSLSQPREVRYQNGRVFSYTYNASLGQVVSRYVRQTPTSTINVGGRSFTYQEKTGLLASSFCSNVNTSYNRTLGYDTFGNLSRDDVNQDVLSHISPEKCETRTLSTVRGKPLSIDIKLTHSTSTDDPLNIRKTYTYNAADGSIDQIEILVNDTLRSRSKFLRNTDGFVSNIDSYCWITEDYYSRIQLRKKYGAYGLITESKYVFSDGKNTKPIAVYNATYNKRNTLQMLKLQVQSINCTENYNYDRTGFLTEWKINGDLMLENEYAKNIISQTFVQETNGNLRKVTTTAATGGNRSNYYYDVTGSKLSEITNTDVNVVDKAGLGYPREIKLEQDAEGHVVKETTGDTIRTFSYLGEDNFSDITTTTGNTRNASTYCYNPSGKIIKTRHIEDGQPSYQSRFYAEGEIIADVSYSEITSPLLPPRKKSYQIYHRINGDILFITLADTDPTDRKSLYFTTFSCLNQLNGSQLAIGQYERAYTNEHAQALSIKAFYRYHINGQNPYGFTFNIKSQQVLVERGIYKKYPKGNMALWRKTPPAVGPTRGPDLSDPDAGQPAAAPDQQPADPAIPSGATRSTPV